MTDVLFVIADVLFVIAGAAIAYGLAYLIYVLGGGRESADWLKDDEDE